MILCVCSHNFIFKSSTVDHKNELDQSHRYHNPDQIFKLYWIRVRFRLQEKQWHDKFKTCIMAMIITGKPEKNVTLVVHLTQLFKFLKLISVTLTTSCRPDSIKIFNPKV